LLPVAAAGGMLFSMVSLEAAEGDWPPIVLEWVDDTDWLIAHQGENGKGAPERRILAALGSQTKLEFDETLLEEVIAYLQELHGIPILLDHKALAAEGVSSESSVTLNIQGVSLSAGLRHLCRLFEGVAFTVKDEAVLITSQKVADATLLERAYNVAPLLKQGETAASVAACVDRAFGREKLPATPQPAQPKPAKADSAPQVAPFREALLVRGTQQQQEQVVRLLTALKRSLEGEVTENAADTRSQIIVRQYALPGDRAAKEYYRLLREEAQTFPKDGTLKDGGEVMASGNSSMTVRGTRKAHAVFVQRMQLVRQRLALPAEGPEERPKAEAADDDLFGGAPPAVGVEEEDPFGN
jgi:hypothetical protein